MRRPEVIIGNGTYQAGEKYILIRVYRGKSQPRLAVLFHGANQAVETILNTANGSSFISELTRRRFDVLIPLAGGLTNWGADVALTAFTAMKTWAEGTPHGPPLAVSNMAIAAWSMGNITALNIWKTNLGLFKCYAGLIAGLDLKDLRDRDILGSQASIDAVYTAGGGFTAQEPTHNPNRTGEAEVFLGKPTKHWYSGNDIIYPDNDPTGSKGPVQWCTRAGGISVNFGNASHTDTGLPYVDVADFMAANVT